MTLKNEKVAKDNINQPAISICYLCCMKDEYKKRDAVGVLIVVVGVIAVIAIIIIISGVLN
jgi:hypothetical protein